MINLKSLLLCIGCFLISLAGYAQDQYRADTMRSNGRIYVVVAVALTILIGLILYLVRLDKKISKLEKENK
jgi:hypothetical protein